MRTLPTLAKSAELERFLSETAYDTPIIIRIREGCEARVEDLTQPFEVNYRGYRPVNFSGDSMERIGVDLRVARPEEERTSEDMVRENTIHSVTNVLTEKTYTL